MSKTKKLSGESEVEEVFQGDTIEGPIDLAARVKVEITDDHDKHQYEVGETIECSPVLASKIVNNGWGKIVKTLALLMMFGLGAFAQSTSYQKLAKSVSNLPTNAFFLIYSDTVTNTATNFITTGYPQYAVSTGATAAFTYTGMATPAFSTTIQVSITKISGLVAGTVTLQGSLDGVSFSTVASPTLAITATATATDVASQSFSWVVGYNPYRFYRISWTGVGTMAASMTARVWSH